MYSADRPPKQDPHAPLPARGRRADPNPLFCAVLTDFFGERLGERLEAWRGGGGGGFVRSLDGVRGRCARLAPLSAAVLGILSAGSTARGGTNDGIPVKVPFHGVTPDGCGTLVRGISPAGRGGTMGSPIKVPFHGVTPDGCGTLVGGISPAGRDGAMGSPIRVPFHGVTPDGCGTLVRGISPAGRDGAMGSPIRVPFHGVTPDGCGTLVRGISPAGRGGAMGSPHKGAVPRGCPRWVRHPYQRDFDGGGRRSPSVSEDIWAGCGRDDDPQPS